MDTNDVLKKRIEWMGCNDRTHELYVNGVIEFLDFAFANSSSTSVTNDEELTVPCPCYKCNNKHHKKRQDIFEDLMVNGIVRGYVRWVYHGEYKTPLKRSRAELEDRNNDRIFDMIRESRKHAAPNDEIYDNVEFANNDSFGDKTYNMPMDEAIIDKLINDAKQPLYPGCEEFSKLSFILKMFQTKCIDGMTNKAFSNILKMFKSALPKGNDIPTSYYEARKMITDLGFDYEKIEACENDCMLFWEETANLVRCSTCGKERVKNPSNVLRYFPLTPRLQRFFSSTMTSDDMIWHFKNRKDDGILRHPADSEAWKNFDNLYPSFASDPRNVRLGLASDGFNPFGGLRSDYSIWPVVILIYNLPPWMCMKQPYSILSLLIPGKSSPGNNIDVYLRPLVKELQQLWNVGSLTYDVSTGESFQMRAALMWTINDFPAYANLSGWSTKGYKACPCCMNDTTSMRLPNCSKICYMDHRRFLPKDHKWRDSKAFNGKQEKRDPPSQLLGADILCRLHDLKDMKFGKTISHPKRDDNWKKKSIFFDLPYWSSLLIRHNLDVMHIEKNVCDNILGTLLDVEGKTKDSIKARHDLKVVNIMKHLSPKLVNGKWHIPPAPYTLSKAEKEKVYKFLQELKVPDGYSSNISKCINLDKRKIWGLKSHDCHVILEQLLPFAIRGVSQPKVYEAIAKFSIFFKELCSKTLTIEVLDRIQESIILTLCEMEKIFLPSFFDVMVHLCVHLAAEAKIAGPVQYRWMYPVERLLRKFKCYVRNKSRPEGSIAEGYIIEECMIFCSRYLTEIETKFNQYERNADKDVGDYKGLEIFKPIGTPLGKAKTRPLTDIEVRQAHEYVLINCEEAETYIREYKEGEFDDSLTTWFQDQMSRLAEEEDDHMLQDLKTLSLGPLKGVQSFNGYLANGFRFHTRDVEIKRRNQNSGVMVKGDELDYYGVLTEIICLQYLDGKRVVLFRCDWWDVHSKGRGVKVDKFGFVSVNTKRRLHTNEPFVLMSQAQQVFYVKDGTDPNWLIVIKTHPRHYYDNPEKEHFENDGDALQQSQPESTHEVFLSALRVDDSGTTSEFVRDDMENNIVDLTDTNQPKDLNNIENEDDNGYESSVYEDDPSDTDSDIEVDEDADIA